MTDQSTQQDDAKAAERQRRIRALLIAAPGDDEYITTFLDAMAYSFNRIAERIIDLEDRIASLERGSQWGGLDIFP